MTCESVMTVLRKNRDSLMAVLEAFVYDPLFNWCLGDSPRAVGTRPWRGGVVPGRGGEVWYPEVAGRCGTQRWREGEVWYPAVAGRVGVVPCGGGSGKGGGVPGCGGSGKGRFRLCSSPMTRGRVATYGL